YLIFKEGINNAITHSGGSEILLNARVQGRRLEMELRDNGRGFESETRREGNGLSNMQARARKIGGELLIETRPGGGTVLRFSGNMR
ncbi:MAG: histidine kinase, partial [Calditrichaeota bacterium]|nr:histidine kinase [Calditrichota bacterium]